MSQASSRRASGAEATKPTPSEIQASEVSRPESRRGSRGEAAKGPASRRASLEVPQPAGGGQTGSRRGSGASAAATAGGSKPTSEAGSRRGSVSPSPAPGSRRGSGAKAENKPDASSIAEVSSSVPSPSPVSSAKAKGKAKAKPKPKSRGTKRTVPTGQETSQESKRPKRQSAAGVRQLVRNEGGEDYYEGSTSDAQPNMSATEGGEGGEAIEEETSSAGPGDESIGSESVV